MLPSAFYFSLVHVGRVGLETHHRRPHLDLSWLISMIIKKVKILTILVSALFQTDMPSILGKNAALRQLNGRLLPVEERPLTATMPVVITDDRSPATVVG